MSAVGYTPAVEMLVDVLLKVPEEPGLEREEEWNGDGKQEPALGWKEERRRWNMTLEHWTNFSGIHNPLHLLFQPSPHIITATHYQLHLHTSLSSPLP